MHGDAHSHFGWVSTLRGTRATQDLPEERRSRWHLGIQGKTLDSIERDSCDFLFLFHLLHFFYSFFLQFSFTSSSSIIFFCSFPSSTLCCFSSFCLNCSCFLSSSSPSSLSSSYFPLPYFFSFSFLFFLFPPRPLLPVISFSFPPLGD